MTEFEGPTAFSRRVRETLPAAMCAALLLLFIPLAVKTPTIGYVAIVLVIFIIVLTSFGLARTGAACCIGAMFLAPMTAVTLPGGASFVTGSDLLFVAGFGLLWPVLIHNTIRVPAAFALGSAAFFIVGCVTSLGADSPFGSLNLLARVLAATVFLPLAFIAWAPRGKTLVALACAYAAGLAFDVLVAVAQGPAVNGRYKGLTEEPTAFGYAGLLAACLLPFIYSKLPQGQRWMVFPTGVIALYGIWISGSRASLLVLVILAALYPVMERSVKITGFLVFIGVVFIANLNRLLDQNGGSNALSRLLTGSAGAGGSDQARKNGLSNAWQVVKAHPIIGDGFDFDAFLAHNLYVQVAATVGGVGVIAFVFILIAFVRPLFYGPKPYRLLGYPALAYIIAGPITPNLGSRYVTVLLALSLVVANMDESDAEEPPPPAVPLRERRRTRARI